MPVSLSNEMPPVIKKTNKMHLSHKNERKEKKREREDEMPPARLNRHTG